MPRQTPGGGGQLVIIFSVLGSLLAVLAVLCYFAYRHNRRKAAAQGARER